VRITLAPSTRGIALIIVLIVIVVLGILAGGFAYSMKVETTLARHASFSSELDWLGRAGVEVAKWVLSQSSMGPNGQVDSLKQKWAGGPGETNDILASIDLKNYQIYTPEGTLRGTLSIDIIDLDRKFNINAAANDPLILQQALTLVGVDAGSFATIVGSIQDWCDRDEDPHMSGTETRDYEQENPPYRSKNGPIDDLSELLLIRGIKEDPGIYWGSGAGSVYSRPSRSRLGSAFEQRTYAVGLKDLFTPLSSGKLNINTASATVLQIIPIIDENIAQSIIQRRAGPDGQEGTEDDMPFRSAAEISFGGFGGAGGPGVPGNPAAMGQFSQLFTVRSLVFEVHVTATAGSSKREYVAILRRDNPKNISTLNLYWK
jgi:hypothetical protein